MPWDIVDADYTERVTIVLVGTSTSPIGMPHYIVVVGVSDDGEEFMVTDTTEKLYRVSGKQLSSLMRIHTTTTTDTTSAITVKKLRCHPD